MTTTVHLAPPLADVLSGGCRVVMRTRDQRPKSLLHLIFDRLLCKLVRAGMVSPSSQSFSSSCQWMLDGRLLSLVCHHENSPSSLSLLIFFFILWQSRCGLWERYDSLLGWAARARTRSADRGNGSGGFGVESNRMDHPDERSRLVCFLPRSGYPSPNRLGSLSSTQSYLLCRPSSVARLYFYIPLILFLALFFPSI